MSATDASPDWQNDDALLAGLRDAVQGLDAAPNLFAAASAAYSWRAVDAELLEVLTAESWEPADRALAVRGADTAIRTLFFRGVHLSIEVEVASGAVVGQLIPPQPGRVELSTPQGRFAETRADEQGCFLLPRPDSGAVRLTCRTPQTSIVTEWLPL